MRSKAFFQISFFGVHLGREGRADLRVCALPRHTGTVSGSAHNHPITSDVLNLDCGTPLFVRFCLPEGTIKGRVILSHGVSEHGGRYEHVMRALAQRGWASAIADHQGHGRSSTTLALSPDLSRLAQHLTPVREALRERAGDGPFVLWGHSMGALVSLLHLADSQAAYQGAVLASAATKIPEHVPPALVRFADRLARWIPSVHLLPGNSCERLSRDPEMIERTKQDPLMHKKGMRAATGAAILGAILKVPEIAPKIRLPVLLTHGDQDKVMPVQASRELYPKLGSMDKTLRIYEGWVHELHNEAGREEYLRETLDWIELRFEEATAALSGENSAVLEAAH